MKRQESWFMEQRAKHLAILHLTRRGDLFVTESPVDYGLDLLVEVSKDNRATGRLFGVQVKASNRLPVLAENAFGRNTVTISLQVADMLEDLPFPLCLFIFHMLTDEGYYKWIREPIISAKEEMPQLRRNRENVFTRLTRETLDEIVQQVDVWYAGRYVPEYQQEVYA